MARIPHNIERVIDYGVHVPSRDHAREYSYRWIGYLRDGFAARISRRADGGWHIVAVTTGTYIGKARTLAGCSELLSLYDRDRKSVD